MSQPWYVRVFNSLPGTKVKSRDMISEFTLVQQGFDYIESAIKIKSTQAAGEQTLDLNVASRASKLIGFDASGNVTVTTGTFVYRGNWATATAYSLNDVVRDPNSPYNVYVCAIAHTSGVLATDITAVKWVLILDMSYVATEVASAAASAVAADASADAAAVSAAAADVSADAAAASALIATNTADTNTTSTTSNSFGTGSKSWTTAPIDRSIVVGMTYKFARTSEPAKWMAGTVTAYTPGTGAITVDIDWVNPYGGTTGPYTDWTGSLAAPLPETIDWSMVTGEPTTIAGYGITDTKLEDYNIVDANNALFGDGSDGDATITSGTTTLTSNKYYNNLTISGTGSIDTAGYIIYVNGTLDLTAAPAGAITRTPNNGSIGGASGGSAGTTLSSTNDLGGSVPGNDGRDDGSTNSAGTSASVVADTGARAGGRSGATGAAGSAVGGTYAGGSGSSKPSTVSGAAFSATLRGTLTDGNAVVRGGLGGTGGPSGGRGTSGNTSGGGGGSGGGAIDIRAREIARGGSTAASAIKAIGGNGGDGSSPGAGNSGGGSGGSGGGGGFVHIVVGSLSGSTGTNVIDVSGGNGGNGGNGNGTGTNGSGADGGDSGAFYLTTTGSGRWTFAKNGPGSTAGGAAVTTTGGTGASQKYNL